MPSTQTPLIDVKTLNVVYFPGKSNEVHALKDISLEIYPGEFIIFFGPSGCGKSTLLYSISGLETNITGDVLVKGQNLPTMTKKQREIFHQKTIGMVFQAFYLIPSLSVLQNVALPQMALNVGTAAREERALKLMDRFGIAAQAGKLPQELSGGQQQRVALCRSLMNDPEILFADEPVGNLDSKSSEEVMKLLRELNDRDKKTVILVTHDPSHLHNAHRVFYVRDGQIVRVQENTEEERKESPVVKEAKAESAKAQAPVQGLEQWAKTLTAEDLRRAAEMGKDAVQAEVNDLLKQLTPEQRTKVEEYIRDLLAGVQTKLDENDMERLARGILRLLQVPESQGDVTTRVRTWRTGAEVLLFEKSVKGTPVLTLAAVVRLRPVLLRLKWMLIALLAFIPRWFHAASVAIGASAKRAWETLTQMARITVSTVNVYGARIVADVAAFLHRSWTLIRSVLRRVWVRCHAFSVRLIQSIRARVRAFGLKTAQTMRVGRNAAIQALSTLRDRIVRRVRSCIDMGQRAIRGAEQAVMKGTANEMATLRSQLEHAAEGNGRRMHRWEVRWKRSFHRVRNEVQHLLASLRRVWRHWHTRSHRHHSSSPTTKLS